ncbi:MAG: hypothetical protein RBR71_12855 [Gudongella sp.]|nr:hypothetical protein [Gudongella sp.]
MYDKKTVLIITSAIDTTVDYIVEKYNSDVDFFRLNVDEINRYNISIGNNKFWIIEDKKYDRVIEKSQIYSIYYRKPRLPNLQNYENIYHNMITKDIIAVINGLVDEFDGKVLTKPYILRKTENKIYQLLYAERNEFLTPKSFIGNDGLKASKFLKQKSIIKPIGTGKLISGNHCELYQTSYFTELDEDISLTPIYLQEYIEKSYEVRLTWINDTVFPVKIVSRDKLDWRKDYSGHQYSMIKCPKLILEKCRKMLLDLELTFGAFDFIVNEKNDWVFLEVNPNGQWQWLENALNIDISGKIIEYLSS